MYKLTPGKNTSSHVETFMKLVLNLLARICMAVPPLTTWSQKHAAIRKVSHLMHPSGAAWIKCSDVWLALQRYAKSTDQIIDYQEINEYFILKSI